MQRKIRMGMVGGGPGSFIGAAHRRAANLDGKIELVAPEERFVPDPENSPFYETFWLDEQEKLVPTNRDWLHE